MDVGFGNTKYISNVARGDIRCASFPSIAYPSMREPSIQPRFERRKTVVIPINSLFYEVGPEVKLAADTFRATQMHDRYIETPEYMALLRGALAMMKVPVIDLLVVGLPVAALTTKKGVLEKAVTGTHGIGNGKTVVVLKALAIAQLQGTLVDFAVQHQKMATIEREQSLIIDPGSRTFDWLVARGMRLVQNKSRHSVNRGASDMLQGHHRRNRCGHRNALHRHRRDRLGAAHREEPCDLPKALRHLAGHADGAFHRAAGRGADDAMGGGELQLPEHHPGRRRRLPVQEGDQGGLSEAQDPGGERSAARERQRIPDCRDEPRAEALRRSRFACPGRCVMANTKAPAAETIRMLFELDRDDDPRLYDDLI